MTRWLSRLGEHAVTVGALVLLVLAMGGTWLVIPRAGASPLDMAAATTAPPAPRPAKPPVAVKPPSVAKTAGATALVGKVNINTATAAELERLPTIGPAKAARIVLWRQKNGAFRRTVDLRRVKGIAYKSFKRLEPYVDIAGPTTLGVGPAPAPAPAPANP